jgi:hypothetical protein
MRRFLLILTLAATAHAPRSGTGRIVRWIVPGHRRAEKLDSAREQTFGVNYYFKQHDVKLQLDYLRGPDAQHKVLARLQTVF